MLHRAPSCSGGAVQVVEEWCQFFHKASVPDFSAKCGKFFRRSRPKFVQSLASFLKASMPDFAPSVENFFKGKCA